VTELIPPEGQGIHLLAELERAGALSSVGLKLSDPDLTYEVYESVGALLGEMRKRLQWAIGDFVLIGERLFGHRTYQAAENLEISEEVLREYVRVAERIPRSVRRPELPWSTHRAVASLEIPEQKRWLGIAVEKGLSHHALREALREGEPPKQADTCRCCHRPL
jgi:hypothetical protein